MAERDANQGGANPAAGQGDTDRSEAYLRGREIRRQLMGERYADRMGQSAYADPIMQQFLDVATETIFGSLWSRPGLDLKTRTLITVVSDASTGRTEELAIHLRMALRQGWSAEELTEALLHLLGYIGAPLVRGALLTAKDVFAEMRAAD